MRGENKGKSDCKNGRGEESMCDMQVHLECIL